MIRLRQPSSGTLADSVMAVIRCLDEYFSTGDREVLADARKGICDLATRHEALTVANSLWDISLTLQREVQEK